jgi:hypothetical protein
VTAGTKAPAWAKRALRPLRSRAGEYPLLVPVVLRLITPSTEDLRITAATELVIEGFPRSGNSFATTAFGLAAGPGVRRSSNTHLPGQVRIAVSKRLPTLVLIRRCADAAASLCVAAPYLRPADAVREWTRFYRAVRPLRRGYVLATFEEVTTDFGAVLARVNERFGTTFPLFVHTDDNVALVQRRLEDYGVRKRGYLREESIARPSGARSAANRVARDAMTTGAVAPLLVAADALYDDLVSRVDRR